MSAVKDLLTQVLNQFQVAKVLTIAELILLLQCSRRTVQRRLKSWGAIGSYNHNGRYFTLPQVASFDENGLWRWREVRFSRYGNLTETLLGVVEASPAGLTAGELGELLGLDAHAFLSHFAGHQGLRREKLGGRYVYFAADPERLAMQRRARAQRPIAEPAGLPSNALAVEIFAAMIRHPEEPPGAVARRLQARGMPVDSAAIEALLSRHGLAKGGAADSASSRP